MALAHAAVAAAAIAVGATAPSPRPAPAVVTQAQSGKTFRLAVGRELTLRLSGRWGWTEPQVRGRGVDLTPVAYLVDPGYEEWQLSAHVRGRVTIGSVGTPACDGCGRSPRRFHVTFVVR